MTEKIVTNDPDNKIIYFGIPNDIKIQAGFGILTIRHGQLDYALRLTIKSLAGLSIEEALDATTWENSAELRKRITKLARQKLGEGQALLKLQALLERARRVTEKRNKYIHSLWAHELDGSAVIRNEDHSWEPVPTASELDALSKEISGITNELTKERLDGFLSAAIEKMTTL